MAVIDNGSNTSGKANVDSQYNLQVNSPGYTAGGVARGGGEVEAGASSIYSAVDEGQKNGVREVLSPEVDKDYRLRIAQDNMLDQELFNYTSQNTAKHQYVAATMASTMTSSGLTTNSGGITTTTTGVTFGTWAMFPVGGTQGTICETSVAFSAQPTANMVIDFGLFQRNTSNPFAPSDGVYFRLSAAGLQGVTNSGGVETTTSVFPLSGGTGTFTYVNNSTNRYLLQINNVSTSFWINNYKYGEIPTPAALNFPCKSLALPWSVRHSIVGGAAGTGLQAVWSDYRVFSRGEGYDESLGTTFNRVLGSYQGLSGGTMGSLATYPNSANPTAAAPSNTALTANLPAGLGGQGLATAAAAAATDGIWNSYQVPAGSSTVQGRRLKISGVTINAVNMGAAVATTATTLQWSLAFGHTAASLATAETASMTSSTTKAPRRIPLGFMNWPIGAAIGAGADKGPIYVPFTNPVYVNPGEFVAAVAKFINGTATASQTIQYTVTYDYGWE